MNALSRMVAAVRPEGLVLDLQVIRPDPQIELDGQVVAEIDGEQLFLWADAATAAIDAMIAAGGLVEEMLDEHDVRTHYSGGAELIGDFVDSKRRLPETELPLLQRIDRPLAVRERCRLRRLRVRRRDVSS